MHETNVLSLTVPRKEHENKAELREASHPLLLSLVVCGLAFWARNGILFILDWFVLLLGFISVENLSNRKCLVMFSWRTLCKLHSVCWFIFILGEPFHQNREKLHFFVISSFYTSLWFLFFFFPPHFIIKMLIISSLLAERRLGFYGQLCVSSWSSVSTHLLCAAQCSYTSAYLHRHRTGQMCTC